LDLSEEDENYLLHWSKSDVAQELRAVHEYLDKFGEHLPAELKTELDRRTASVK